MDDTQRDRISTIQARYSAMLMNKPHVIGTAIGYQQKDGQSTGVPALVVLVDQKVPADQLSPDDLIPKELEGVPVDVQSVGGTFRAG